jgi:hypothetical protein
VVVGVPVDEEEVAMANRRDVPRAFEEDERLQRVVGSELRPEQVERTSRLLGVNLAPVLRVEHLHVGLELCDRMVRMRVEPRTTGGLALLP